MRGSFDNPYKNIDERRANVGKAGRQIRLVTNHFDMTLAGKSGSIHRYDVEMSLPQWKRPPKKSDMNILIRAFEGKTS